MDRKIRVQLVDDHAVLRAGLRALLNSEPDIEVVGEAGSGEEAIDMAKQLLPDIVVTDIVMPGIDGLEATQRITTALPHCRVLILTMYKQAHYLFKALKVGASGYILKSDLDTELVEAIRTASRGDAFVYSSDTRAFFRAYLEQGGTTRGPEGLSEMENRVLKLTAQGYSNRQIGEMLSISPRTVDTYRARIMNKLGLASRAELHGWALQHGLLQT
ncbi:MAG: response regulator transcription factor [Chloroflexi bacterium]|nr:response regulator transcription factor [Chloroflexota bacterium]